MPLPAKVRGKRLVICCTPSHGSAASDIASCLPQAPVASRGPSQRENYLCANSPGEWHARDHHALSANTLEKEPPWQTGFSRLRGGVSSILQAPGSFDYTRYLSEPRPAQSIFLPLSLCRLPGQESEHELGHLCFCNNRNRLVLGIPLWRLWVWRCILDRF